MLATSRNTVFRLFGATVRLLRVLVMVFVYGLLCYALFAAVSAMIPMPAEEMASTENPSYDVYLLKSGPHTDFFVKAKTEVHDWTLDFPYVNNADPDTTLPWLAIGWGDKGFYLNTPTWADLTVSTAVSAATGLGTAGIHATYY
jgi:hypothetical protein